MATITADWDENQALTTAWDDDSPGNTVTSTCSIDLDANGYDMVVVQIRWTFHASATGSITVSVYGDVNSGSAPSDIADFSIAVAATAGASKELNIPIRDMPFVDITFYNGTGQEVTNLASTFAGRKWVST